MRARIIFRGLTLFEFSKGTEGAKPNDDRGELTAWLISDPKHEGMPLHHHKPYWGLNGRNVGSPTGPGRIERKKRIPHDMRIELVDPNLPKEGVRVEGSFLDYVPRLGDLHKGPVEHPDDSLVARKIVIPTGRIRAREFISWDWHGNTPARVAYMDTPFQGYGANEVIVDIGDDSDIHAHDDRKFLSVTGKGLERRLWAHTKGGDLIDDIDPNTVELLITNLTARRRRPIFWGLHFQLLFDAVGFAQRSYAGGPEFGAFVNAARAYDPDEWRTDSMMPTNQPFPYIIDPRQEILPGIGPSGPVTLKGPPPTPTFGRQKGEGLPGAPMGTGMDPLNTEICPFGRI